MGGSVPPLGTSKLTEPKESCVAICIRTHLLSYKWVPGAELFTDTFSLPTPVAQEQTFKKVTGSDHWMKFGERYREMIKEIQGLVGRERRVCAIESNKKVPGKLLLQEACNFLGFIHSMSTQNVPSVVLGADGTDTSNTLYFLHPQSSQFSVGDRRVNQCLIFWWQGAQEESEEWLRVKKAHRGGAFLTRSEIWIQVHQPEY